MTPRITLATLLLVCLTSHAVAWDPPTGDWGRTDPTDIRVMTWNIKDNICSSNSKLASTLDWDGVVRIVAAMQPDILVMQEVGDNSGNGTGSGVDSVANLTTTLDLFLHGGNDPFKGNTAVTSYVQLYAPAGYDLPFIFVSAKSDNFNRNIILSRFPFIDLNGDGIAVNNDIPLIRNDTNQNWAPGGTGGIRGQPWVEVDLPDGTYLGDIVAGCTHLKAGGNTSDFDQRDVAARNASYFIHYGLGGAGTGTPDPNGKILPSPQAILNPNTPVVWGGDYNEDEDTNGRRGPAAWFSEGPSAGGTDGCDRDTTDASLDNALEFFTGADGTFGSNTKLDYIMYQDSIATKRRSWVYNAISGGTAAFPPEIIGYPGNPALISVRASDHKPVLIDLILPMGSPPDPFAQLSPADTAASVSLNPIFSWQASTGADDYSLLLDNPAPIINQASIASTSFASPVRLDPCSTYTLTITANNANGQTNASNAPTTFTTRALADVTTTNSNPGDPGFGIPDGAVNGGDLSFFVEIWLGADPNADVTTTNSNPGDPGFGVPDGAVNGGDLSFFVEAWLGGGCP